MNIEIWSDYMCPFCYIGKKRLEDALSQFEHKDQVKVMYRSFELDPSFPRDASIKVVEMLADKYGMSVEQAKGMQDQVALQAKASGLTFNFDAMIHTNTRDAHRLSHYAAEQGKGKEMNERIFYAAFTQSMHVADRKVLVTLAEEIGLERQKVEQLLESNQYDQEVQADEARAAALGVRGVPYFLIDGKLVITGAQSTEKLLEALQYAWEEHKQSEGAVSGTNSAGTDAAGCADGSCSL